MAPKPKESHLIFILPQRIQKTRLRDMKLAARKNNLNITENIGSSVTHIVAECTHEHEAQKMMEDLGIEIDTGQCCFVNTIWLTSCLKNKSLVDVTENHKLKASAKPQEDSSPSSHPSKVSIPEWGCQRETPLHHVNEDISEALDTLAMEAELRAEDTEHSRALAFRRASSVVKSFKERITHVQQLAGLKNMGKHSCRVIKEILEDGSCEEVETIKNSSWFTKMKMFTKVFGVGPATAKKWIENGWTSLETARKEHRSADWRLTSGLAHYEDLLDPVTKSEAENFLRFVQAEAEKVLPGIIVTLVGGFRRGKQSGHDIDLLFTHPHEGKEQGFLEKLLQQLHKCGIILCGKHEASSYSASVASSAAKSHGNSQMDHFEKWLGMVKIVQNSSQKTIVRESFLDPAEGDFVNMSRQITGQTQKHLCGEPKAGEGTPHRLMSNASELQEVSGETTANQCTNTCSQRTTSHSHGEEAKTMTANESVTETKINSVIANRGHKRHGHVIDSGTGNENNPHGDQGEGRPVKRQKTATDNSVQSQSKIDNGANPNNGLKDEGHAKVWKARRVDLIVCPYSQFYFALVGWTGSKQFNRDLRLYATRVHNCTLTSHSLYSHEQGKQLTAESEEMVFTQLGLPCIDPHLRNC